MLTNKTSNRRSNRSVLWAAALLAGSATAASALPPPLPPVQRQAPNRSQPDRQPARHAAQSKAHLVFVKDVHNFGRIFDDEKQEIQYEFANDGTEDLVITLVKPTCGCTLANIFKLGSDGEKTKLDPTKPDDMTFAPADRGMLDITFDPNGKKGDQHRKVNIFSNDSQSPQRSVSIEGYVRPVIQFDPALVSFGAVDVGTGVTKIVRVMGMTEDFAASRPTFDDMGVFEAKVIGTEWIEFGGDTVRATTIEITAPANLKPATYNTKMNVRTNDNRKRIVEIPVFAAVKGPVEVVPPRLAVGNLRVGQPINRSFIVRSRTGQPFEIASVTLDREDLSGLEFTHKLRVKDDLTQHVITLSGTLSQPMARTTAVVKITTSLKEHNVIEMPMILGVIE
ncbi:MAG: hypothetical protein ACI89L_001456 [Phycisphaerales bacterium]|jgi:hypothetical protein